MKQVGDICVIESLCGDVECIITEVSPEDGRITKAKAVSPDEELLKVGFFQEGEDHVIFEIDIITKN